MSKSTYSLRKRLVLAFGVLLILFLGLVGFVLDRTFKESVMGAVEERLQLQIYTLLGVADLDAAGFFRADLKEQKFAQLNSGLYGFIFDSNETEVWRSDSAANISLVELNLSEQKRNMGETTYGSVETFDQGRLFYASFGTFWAAQKDVYDFVILETVEPTDVEIKEFQNDLWGWLGGLTVLLSIAQYLLLRWGMQPLSHLAAELADIESGQSDHLSDDYPKELKAVSNNLNLLIKSERQRQGRYRTTLGDLAHSLKTPLAVISNIVQKTSQQALDEKDRQDMEEQLERMNQIVSYQLKRAVKSASSQVLATPINVIPVFEKILSALHKVYFEKNIQLHSILPDQVLFYGEESDLMELSGNLLDNAFKYCEKTVEVKVIQQDKGLLIEINDDGQGVAEADRHWVLERGTRADTVKSGQGIGLAVAVDIVSSYGGELSLGESTLGGASVTVVLP